MANQLTKEEIVDNIREIRNGEDVKVDNLDQLAQMCYYINATNQLYATLNDQGNVATVHDAENKRTTTVTTKSASAATNTGAAKPKTEIAAK